MSLFTLLGCVGTVVVDDKGGYPYPYDDTGATDTDTDVDTDTDTDTPVDTDTGTSSTDTLSFVPKELMTALDHADIDQYTWTENDATGVSTYYSYDTSAANLNGSLFQLVWAEFRDTTHNNGDVSSQLFLEGLTSSDASCYGLAERSATLFADGTVWGIGDSSDVRGASDFVSCDDGTVITGDQFETEVLGLLDDSYPGSSDY